MKKALLLVVFLILAGLVLVNAQCGETPDNGVVLPPEPDNGNAVAPPDNGAGNNEIVQPSSSDYKVYANDLYGFNLEYPANWYLLGEADSTAIFFSSKDEEPPMGGVSLGARIEMFVLANDEGLTLDEWIEWSASEGPEKNIMQTEEITIAGVDAVKETHDPVPGPVEAGPAISVYFPLNSKIIRINYTGREPEYFNQLSNLNHLLETIQFQPAG
ncbi:hypothetical protein KJ969_02840 [Patescibacteria group bacterium]|nr:hypothetical protein [Patescibacteria group bacterium]MBU1922550.1 hypothetical protein [Patescibacteria group bacterium]